LTQEFDNTNMETEQQYDLYIYLCCTGPETWPPPPPPTNNYKNIRL